MMSLAKTPWDFRGVVYDVGLRFTPESCSVDSLDTALVAYDMSVIANILRANAVRIEGEDVSRLVAAPRTESAFQSLEDERGRRRCGDLHG